MILVNLYNNCFNGKTIQVVADLDDSIHAMFKDHPKHLRVSCVGDFNAHYCKLPDDAEP